MPIEIIAEIGSSHGGDYYKALRLISEAALAGANVAKFQLFASDSLWRKDDSRRIAVEPLALREQWLPTLKDSCEAHGLEFMCTPFSPQAVESLERLGVRRYKIASGDITYMPLLDAVNATGKDIFLSVGFATFQEIESALNRLTGRKRVVLLYCTGGYPTRLADIYLHRLAQISYEFSLPAGLSAHWKEWWIDLSAIPHIVAVERHIDLKESPGPEAGHSLDQYEFAQYVSYLRQSESAWSVWPGESYSFGADDKYAREHYRRDPSDWLRPVKRIEAWEK